MKTWILIVTLALTGIAVADEPAIPPEPGAAGAPRMDANAQARAACTAALNSDPDFAKSIIATVDKQIDQKTIDAHVAASAQIQENKQHVVWAYGAMWIIAALFVAFLWMRQQALKAEIAQLRKDLDAAAKESA